MDDDQFLRDEIGNCKEIILQILESHKIPLDIGFSAMVSIIKNCLELQGASKKALKDFSKSIKIAVESVKGTHTEIST